MSHESWNRDNRDNTVLEPLSRILRFLLSAGIHVGFRGISPSWMSCAIRFCFKWSKCHLLPSLHQLLRHLSIHLRMQWKFEPQTEGLLLWHHCCEWYLTKTQNVGQGQRLHPHCSVKTQNSLLTKGESLPVGLCKPASIAEDLSWWLVLWFGCSSNAHRTHLTTSNLEACLFCLQQHGCLFSFDATAAQGIIALDALATRASGVRGLAILRS